MAGGRDKQTLLPISNGTYSVHHHGRIEKQNPPTYFNCSIVGHQLLPKHFIFTLTVGFTFGFSIAYMALSGTGLGARTEMFHGPPPYPEDPHSHDHKVKLCT